MDTKTKKTLLTVTIIVLLMINISALITIFYNKNLRNKAFKAEQDLKTEMEIKGMNRFISEELNLSEEQFSQFQKVNQENMTKTHLIASKLNDKRREMINEIANKNPNLKNLDAIAKEIGELHYDLKRATIHHFLELKDICNEDQQENLNRLFFKMIYDSEFDHARRGRRGKNRGRNPDNRQRPNR